MRSGAEARAAPQESDRNPAAPHPRSQTALFGQARAERTLLEAYRSGRFPHAWIFGGRAGIGKATLAWRLAQFLLAHPDPDTPAVQRAESLFVPPSSDVARTVAAMAAPNVALLRREWNVEAKPPKHFGVIRVDEVRTATRRFRLSAVGGGWRIAIVDAADDLNPQAANALLKIVEEPPPRSVFILVSHRPGRLLPTIRSRCRRLMLDPLGPDDLHAALASFGASADPASLQRAGGSVADALDMTGEGRSRLASEVGAMLRRLPQVEWQSVAGLADRIGPARAEADFQAFVGLVRDYLSKAVRERAGEGAPRLAPLAEVWEKFGDAVRAAETLNLDKRPLILSVFEDLSAATARR